MSLRELIRKYHPFYRTFEPRNEKNSRCLRAGMLKGAAIKAKTKVDPLEQLDMAIRLNDVKIINRLRSETEYGVFGR